MQVNSKLSRVGDVFNSTVPVIYPSEGHVFAIEAFSFRYPSEKTDPMRIPVKYLVDMRCIRQATNAWPHMEFFPR